MKVRPQLVFLFLFVVCAGWQTSVTDGALDPGLSDGDAGPASVFVTVGRSEVSVVTATVSKKKSALCFCWHGAAEGLTCLLSPPGGGGEMG